VVARCVIEKVVVARGQSDNKHTNTDVGARSDIETGEQPLCEMLVKLQHTT
jgi:hypothetical protein